MLTIFHNITKEDITKAEKILIDNGIESDEAQTVLQAIGYALLDSELYGNEKADELHNNETLKKGKEQIRKAALENIIGLMKRHNVDYLYFQCTDNPVLCEHPSDDNETYTLDKILIKEDGKLLFGGSSSEYGDWFEQDVVSTDNIINIATWLEQNEDNMEDWVKS